MLAQLLLGVLLKKHTGCLFSLESISAAACGLRAPLGVRPTEWCLLNIWQCGAASPIRKPTAVCLHRYSWLFFELSGASFQEVITKRWYNLLHQRPAAEARWGLKCSEDTAVCLTHYSSAARANALSPASCWGPLSLKVLIRMWGFVPILKQLRKDLNWINAGFETLSPKRKSAALLPACLFITNSETVKLAPSIIPARLQTSCSVLKLLRFDFMTYVTLISNPKLKRSQPQMLPFLSPVDARAFAPGSGIVPWLCSLRSFYRSFAWSIFFSIHPGFFTLLSLLMMSFTLNGRCQKDLLESHVKVGLNVSRVLGGTYTSNIPTESGNP